MTPSTTPTVALVGTWADVIDEHRSVAGELALVWPVDRGRVSVFAHTTDEQRSRLDRRAVRSWPEGAFGRHFRHDEFDHAVVMVGVRLDSILGLARSVDEGCHLWLQADDIDADDFPIDAPVDWLAEVMAGARSVIVGSDWLAGVARRVSPDGPPVLVMPPAFPIVDSIVDVPDRVIAVVGCDDTVRQYLGESLDAQILHITDDMTSDVTASRLLSARAGVEFRTTERGFASTTVTHMMARGIPTITNLDAHAPFAGSALSSTGLVIVNDEFETSAVEHLRSVLDDDRVWLDASTAAKNTAASWTWADAADVLSQWMSVVGDLEPSTVRVVGAVSS